MSRFIPLPSLVLLGPQMCRIGMEHFEENILSEDIQGFSSPIREVVKLYKSTKDSEAGELRLFVVWLRLRGKDKLIPLRHQSIGEACDTYQKLKDL